mgnify:FL=1
MSWFAVVCCVVVCLCCCVVALLFSVVVGCAVALLRCFNLLCVVGLAVDCSCVRVVYMPDVLNSKVYSVPSRCVSVMEGGGRWR